MTLRDYWRKWLETGLDRAEAFVFACMVAVIVLCTPMLFLILTGRW
jgi:hypothetical protein